MNRVTEVFLQPGLYIVATPIGHLDDITLRALSLLREADLVAAEDTRHTKKLLQHHGINRSLVAYHEHSATQVLASRITEIVQQGGVCALVSDAGTPLISDPGYDLVRTLSQNNVAVIPVPGPSALTAAISVSGLPSDRFLFLGFPPAKSAMRRRWMSELAFERATLVLYEAPHRILDSLADAADIFGGERPVVICRELTKTYETLLRGTLASVLETVRNDPNQQRGEIVVVIGGADHAEVDFGDSEQRLLLGLAEHAPPKVAAAVVGDYLGIKKKTLYEWLLAQKTI